MQAMQVFCYILHTKQVVPQEAVLDIQAIFSMVK